MKNNRGNDLGIPYHNTSRASRNKARKLLAEGIFYRTAWGVRFQEALVDIANASRWER